MSDVFVGQSHPDSGVYGTAKLSQVLSSPVLCKDVQTKVFCRSSSLQVMCSELLFDVFWHINA